MAVVIILLLFTNITLFGVTNAIKCSSGSIVSSNGKRCIPCKPGTYFVSRKDTEKAHCEKCPAGTYTPHSGVRLRSLCLPCGRTKMSKSGSKTCTPCPHGTVSIGDSCQICRPGAYIGQGRCAPCPPSTFSHVYNSNSCAECPPNTVPMPDRARCQRPNCPPGSEPTGDVKNPCVPCVLNTVRRDPMRSCMPCPVRTAPNEERTHCVTCRPGYFLAFGFSHEYTRFCTRCPANHTTHGVSKPFCTSREPGKPIHCPKHTYLDADNDCNRCLSDEYRDVLDRRCKPCGNMGHSIGGWTRQCTQCALKQKVQPVWASHRCSCPVGHVLRSGVCTRCPRGSAKASELRCDVCQPDSFTPREGMEACMPCPFGWSSEKSMGVRCEELPRCRSGYVRLSRAADCISVVTGCPDGSIPTVDGSRTQPACMYVHHKHFECGRDGIFDKESKCLHCPPGTALNIATGGKYVCKKCVGNSFSPGGVTWECSPCPSGFVGDGAACVCPIMSHIVGDLRCVSCVNIVPFALPYECLIPNFVYPQPKEVVKPFM